MKLQYWISIPNTGNHLYYMESSWFQDDLGVTKDDYEIEDYFVYARELFKRQHIK